MTGGARAEDDGVPLANAEHGISRGRALQLIDEITRCPLVERAWANDEHPCGKVVGTQPADPVEFQVPEPWAGHLQLAPLLLVSSNPSISENEPYPVWADAAERRTKFFDERFGSGRTQVRDGVRHPLKSPGPDGSWHSSPVPFWRDCLANVRFLLERDPVPGVDYVMTEVVHCKSKGEAGVQQAVSTCVNQWFERVLSVSPAPVVVTVGAVATRAVASHLGITLPLWDATTVKVAGRSRLIVAVPHTNYHGPRKWSDQMPPEVVSMLRAALAIPASRATATNTADPEPDIGGPPPEACDEAGRPPLAVQQVHPTIALLCERAADMEPGAIRFEVQAGSVRLYAAATSVPFGRITHDDSVILTLPQGDAQRGHERLGGLLDEFGDRSGTWNLEIDADAAADPGAADQALVLLLRALHAAASEPGADFAAPLRADDVAYALTEAEVWSDGPEDMAAYWSARRDALLDLFGLAERGTGLIAGGVGYPRNDIDHAARAIVSGIARRLAHDARPVQGLECPQAIQRVLLTHLEAQEELEKQRQRQGRATIIDLLRVLNPDLDAVVATEADLAKHGVAPCPPRDEVQLIMDGWF